jgi:RimJ/RimL family protein N-acetyltransferase
MNYWQSVELRLRGVEPGDAELFFRWNLDSERARHLDFVWPPVSLAAVRDWCEGQSRRKLENDAFHWVIEDPTGTPVGSISTHNCNPRCGTFSYGVDIDPTQRRRGLASAVICMVMRYYFDELRYQKVTVAVHADNPASMGLHEKLGFQREGTLRRMHFSGGQYIDVHWYGMTAEEFRKLHP